MDQCARTNKKPPKDILEKINVGAECGWSKGKNILFKQWLFGFYIFWGDKGTNKFCGCGSFGFVTFTSSSFVSKVRKFLINFLNFSLHSEPKNVRRRIVCYPYLIIINLNF